MKVEIEIIKKKQKVSTLTFEELKLSEDVLNGIKNADADEASPLQQSILKNVHDGGHVIIKAETGPDKHTALAISALEKHSRAENTEHTCVLILTASPESARQINEVIVSMGSSEAMGPCVDDDGDKDEQAESIAGQASIIVANPNRLQELLKEHRFIFRHLDLLVLDEMDEMVKNDSDGNLTQIKRRILSDYNALICCNALDDAIKKACKLFAKEPAVLGFEHEKSEATPPPEIPSHLNQGYINVPNRMKISTLMAYLEQSSNGNSVIFTASKRGTDRLYRVLKKQGLKATSLHRKLSDEKRAQRFANFTNSDVQYLLVSDISAAELDVGSAVQVINYDVPNSADEYRFRAALAGKGKQARIVSLVSKQDRSDIGELQKELGQTPDEIPLPNNVKEKVNQQRNKKSNANGRSKKRPSRSKPKKKNDMQLPQPSYDKLSGGRNGNHDKQKTGFVKFFKKLFTS